MIRRWAGSGSADQAGEWAQGALSQVMLRHIRHFERMEHSYLRERAVDVRDLGTRVLGYLQDADRGDVDYPERTVLVAEELTASALGEIPRISWWVLCRCVAAQTAIRQYWQGRWASPRLWAWRTCR